jgi:phosphatidylglycerophosphate synthase
METTSHIICAKLKTLDSHPFMSHFFLSFGIVIVSTKPVLLSWFFIILKSIIDGADGELARIKNTPLTPADTSIVFLISS